MTRMTKRPEFRDPRTLTATMVARAIGQPTKKWPGNCYAIASMMVKAKLVEGKAVYGHWLGRVGDCNLFSGKPVVRHGWIRQPNGTVVDPTRWVFEEKKPYIFVGHERDAAICEDFEGHDALDSVCKHCGCFDEDHQNGFFSPCTNCMWPYDEGGDRFLAMSPEGCQPSPKFNPKEKSFNLFTHLRGPTLSFVEGLTNTKRKLSLSQMFWLANRPVSVLGVHAKPIYRAFTKLKRREMIPVDFRRLVGLA